MRRSGPGVGRGPERLDAGLDAAGVRKSKAEGCTAAAEMAVGGRHVPAWNNENKIFLADAIK